MNDTLTKLELNLILEMHDQNFPDEFISTVLNMMKEDVNVQNHILNWLIKNRDIEYTPTDIKLEIVNMKK